MFAITSDKWCMLYKTEEKANAQWEQICAAAVGHSIQLADDYGQKVMFYRTPEMTLVFDDMAKSQLAQIDRMLHTAKTQAKAQQQARNDPALKFAAANGGMQAPMFNPVQ